MRLPNPDRAVVDPAKVRNYLLSPDHPIGRFKAAAFAAAGYHRDRWQRLQQDLLATAALEGARAGVRTRYGRSFKLPAILMGPDGRDMPVVTLWVVRSGEDFPRLVTAIPEDGDGLQRAGYGSPA